MALDHWLFSALGGGQRHGLNDAGIAFFSDDSVRALARETLQNSIDVHREGSPPVEVSFTLLSVDKKEFPGFSSLKSTITMCRDGMFKYVKEDQSRFEENGRQHFEEALALMEEEAIPVLRIRDENTTGLEGSDEDDGSPWDRLIRTQGAPTEHGAGGGSYGIGQRAPFAASALRTVFYGTVRSSGFSFIGKSVWCSWKDQDGVWRQNTGFLGKADNDEIVRGVTDNNLVPEIFRRETQGTDIFVAGFKRKNWGELIADAVLSSFFAAIGLGSLKVKIEDENRLLYEINSDTIHKILEQRYKQAISSSTLKATSEEVEKSLGHARYYLRAITESEPILGESKDLGGYRLYVCRHEEAPQRVAFMRKPKILVYTRMVAVLPGYAAVFICDDKTGNTVLRKFEGPEHNSWQRKVAKRDVVMSEINKFIRSSLESLSDAREDKVRDIADLAQYLPEELPETERDGGNGVGRSKASRKETAQRRAKPGAKSVGQQPPRSSKLLGDSQAANSGPGAEAGGKGGGEDEIGDGTPVQERRSESSGQGGDTGEQGGGPSLRREELRFRAWYDAKSSQTILVITPVRSGSVSVRLRSIDEDNKRHQVEIMSATDWTTGAEISVNNGVIGPLSLLESSQSRLHVRLRGLQAIALDAEVVP